MKLPITHLLFRKVSNVVAIKNVDRGNPKLNIGLFNENMGSIKQLEFLKTTQSENIKPIKFNEHEYGNTDVGRGTNVIPETKDYYMGEFL